MPAPGAAAGTCKPLRFAVVSELPIKRLMRATRCGKSKLAAEQGSYAGLFNPYRLQAAEATVGKASPEESADRTVPILTTG